MTVIFESKYKLIFILEVNKIFQTFRRHLTLLGAITFTKCKFLNEDSKYTKHTVHKPIFHNEYPQKLGDKIKNSLTN